MNHILRIIGLTLGLVISLIKQANNSARDIENRIRFPKSKIRSGCKINKSSYIAPNTLLGEPSYYNNYKLMNIRIPHEIVYLRM